MNEHDEEPVPGLPEMLPPGEHILWQGAPAWRGIARRAFHAGALGAYFGLLVLWRIGTFVSSGESLGHAFPGLAWLAAMAIITLTIVALLAWAIGRTSLYTITNQRIVMRIGIVLTVTFNIPFRQIRAGGLRTYADGTGDIPIVLAGDDRISYLHLWPHARPWRVARAEPMLRAVPNALDVSSILAAAVARSEGTQIIRQTRGARGGVADAPVPEHARPLAAGR